MKRTLPGLRIDSFLCTIQNTSISALSDIKRETHAAESFTFDKAQIASVLNSFENDPFYTHLFTKRIVNIDVACISREHRGKSFVKIYVCFIKYKDSFTAMISLVFCSRIINEFLKHVVLMFTAL